MRTASAQRVTGVWAAVVLGALGCSAHAEYGGPAASEALQGDADASAEPLPTTVGLEDAGTRPVLGDGGGTKRPAATAPTVTDVTVTVALSLERVALPGATVTVRDAVARVVSGITGADGRVVLQAVALPYDVVVHHPDDASSYEVWQGVDGPSTYLATGIGLAKSDVRTLRFATISPDDDYSEPTLVTETDSLDARVTWTSLYGAGLSRGARSLSLARAGASVTRDLPLRGFFYQTATTYGDFYTGVGTRYTVVGFTKVSPFSVPTTGEIPVPDLAVTRPASAPLVNVRFKAPGAYVPTDRRLTLVFDGMASSLGFERTATGALDFPVPRIAGLTYAVTGFAASRTNNERSSVTRTNLTADTRDLEIPLAMAPSVVTPSRSPGGPVAVAGPFTIDDPHLLRVYSYKFEPSGEGKIRLRVHTRERSIALAAHVPALSPASSYAFTLTSSGPFATMAEYCSPAGAAAPLGTRDVEDTQAQSRTFATQ